MEETKTVEPDPAYLMEPIPDDEKQINELLQKESMRSNPSMFAFFWSSTDIPFLRSLLQKNHYQIPKELQCRMFVIFLGIDPGLVTTLADSVWQVNTVNAGIVEDYIHHIYHRFSSNGMSVHISSYSVENETRVKEDALWVLYGLLINSGAPYNNSSDFCHS